MSDITISYEQLEKAAWEANVSIGRLCREAKVSRPVATNWKAGRSQPTLKAYNKLMKAAEELKSKNKFIT